MSVLADTISCTTGVRGSGKTFRCVRWLIDEWIPENAGRGKYITNLPLNVDKICEHFDGLHKKGRSDITGDLVRLSLLVIPWEEERLWRRGESGPWEWLADEDLTGCHMAIDEAHHVAGRRHSKEHLAEWGDFCGESRHRGLSMEFITQYPKKLAPTIWDEAGVTLSVMNRRTMRDETFGISHDDWYQIPAAFAGEFISFCSVIEKRDVDGKKEEEESRRYAMDPYYFTFYNSFERPKNVEPVAIDAATVDELIAECAPGDEAWLSQLTELAGLPVLGTDQVEETDDGGYRVFPRVGGRKAQPWETYGKLGIVPWFMKRNFFRLVLSKPGALVLAVVLLSAGAFRWVMSSTFDSLAAAASPGDEPPPPGDVEVVEPSAPLQKPPERRETVSYDVLQQLAVERGSRVSQLEVELKAAQDRVKELQRSFASADEVTMITDNAVGFSTGEIYRVGDTVRAGQYEGQEVVKVNPFERSVSMSGGDLLWLSFKQRAGGPSSSQLREPLREVAGLRESTTLRPIRGEATQPYGEGNANREPAGVSGPRGGGFNRGGQPLRRPNGNPRSPR